MDIVRGRAIRIIAMVLLEGVSGVSYVGSCLPGTFVGGVANPIDKVFETPVADARIQDLFDFVFFYSIDDYWRRRRLCAAGDRIGSIRGKERGVEHRVDSHLRW